MNKAPAAKKNGRGPASIATFSFGYVQVDVVVRQFFTLMNTVFNCDPTAATVMTTATAINATRMPYSTALAPSSSRIKLVTDDRKFFIIISLLSTY